MKRPMGNQMYVLGNRCMYLSDNVLDPLKNDNYYSSVINFYTFQSYSLRMKHKH
jgi:hypothetical protein